MADNATEMMCTDVTANEKKPKEEQILKPAGKNQKNQRVLESFISVLLGRR